jgi:hypothetical protein
MKKLILIILFISPISFSQTVNDIPFSEIKADYITVYAYNKFLSNKLKVHVDFGQFNSIWRDKDTRFRGRDGKSVQFNSISHVLNYFSSNGYDLISTNVYGINAAIGHTIYYTIIMRKKTKN